jgi:hypothetical protein
MSDLYVIPVLCRIGIVTTYWEITFVLVIVVSNTSWLNLYKQHCGCLIVTRVLHISAQAAYTNEYKISENCQISSWQIWTHKRQDKNKHNTTQKTKEMNNPNPTTNLEGTQVFTVCKQLLCSLSRDVKNSCNLLKRQSYIRTKCLSIFTRPTWTNYISPL